MMMSLYLLLCAALADPVQVESADFTKDAQALGAGCRDGKGRACLAETVRRKVDARRPNEKVTTMWETEASPAKGRSGGPLVDKRGFVLGIASGANDGKGYYVHPDEIH